MGTITKTLIIDVEELSTEQEREFRRLVTDAFTTVTGGPEAVIAGWTVTAATELFSRLEAANRPVQAKVIRAAASAGGMCDRAKVYALGGYDDSRSLRGFTRPVNRIVDAMKTEGILAADAADPMQTIYDPDNPSFQQAKGFGMPPEVAPLLEAPAAS